jgi:hypothetical protein
MQNSHSFVHSSYSLPDVSAVKTARELWWTTQEASSSSPWLFTLTYHPGDEQ